MTDPVQEPDAARERERLAGARDWLRERWCQDHPNEGHVKQLADYARHLAALRASESVPGAVGVSVEEIARAVKDPGSLSKRKSGEVGFPNETIAPWQARAVIALITLRAVEPDPASGAAGRLLELAKDYRLIPSGEATATFANSNWQDKPHRVLYDLCREIESVAAMLAARLSSPRDAGDAETVEQMRDDAHRAASFEYAWKAEVKTAEALRLERDKWKRRALAAEARVADLERQIAGAVEAETAFPTRTRVRKTKGSSWQGIVVGYYRTSLTPDGVCVESEREPGSVQIYPATALVRVEDQETSRGE